MKNNDRTCYTCKKQKNIDSFSKTIKEKTGYSFQCKSCKKEENMLYRYGITIKQYNNMFEQQKGCCAICNNHQSSLNRSLDIDHCHTTGKVRGLLCNKCNRGLGYFKDNIESIKKLLEYLK